MYLDDRPQFARREREVEGPLEHLFELGGSEFRGIEAVQTWGKRGGTRVSKGGKRE